MSPKTADLHVTGIETVNQATAGWGPRLDDLVFTGKDDIPDMMAFVATQIDTFAAAFRRPGPFLLRP